jgi:hypothetical protein
VTDSPLGLYGGRRPPGHPGEAETGCEDGTFGGSHVACQIWTAITFLTQYHDDLIDGNAEGGSARQNKNKDASPSNGTLFRDDYHILEPNVLETLGANITCIASLTTRTPQRYARQSVIRSCVNDA